MLEVFLINLIKIFEEMIAKEEFVFLRSDSDKISISINWMSA